MRVLSTLLLSVFTLSAVAQTQFSIVGKVTEEDGNKAIEMATVQLLKSDSAYVGGVGTSKAGTFHIKSSKPGKYIIKVSYVGFITQFRDVNLTNSKPVVNLGTIKLPTNTIVLKGATISKKVSKVEMKADTFQYNAAAYRLPVGSTLEALVEQLPGAEVSEDGAITINGKSVSQILVDGKDFFRGNTKVAMKNLPTDLINKIKAYDKKSDYAEQTGVDDGEEETVIDLNMKRKLKESWVTNADLGMGTKHRYDTKVFVNRFTDYDRETIYGSANNLESNGRGSSKEAGINLGWNNKMKEREAGHFEIDGNINWNHRNNDIQSRSNSETFLNSGTSSSFSNSRDMDFSHSTNVRGGFRMKWNPDTLTFVMFCPNVSYSESKNWGESRNATFNSNPYDIPGVDNPLDGIFNDSIDALERIAVNTNHRLSKGDNKNSSFDGWGMVIRRLNNMGRNVGGGIWGNYNKGENHGFSRNNINYFQRSDGRRNQFTNQYTNSPSKNWGYGGRIGYSEPITKVLHAQVGYQYNYSYSSNDRSLYQLDLLQQWQDMYAPPIGTYPSDADSLRFTLNMRNSQYATYKNYNHKISLGLKYNPKDIQLHAGVNIEPQRTKLDYNKDKLDTVVVRNVLNVAPYVRFKYKMSKTSQLDLTYRGSSSQPSMVNLLDVTDDSNPLYISKGNPGLKPSWNNNFKMFYNNYNVERQQGWMANVRFNQTSNSISNTIHYDEKTGVRTTRPENINGKWNVGSDFMFNTAFGKEKSWNVTTYTSLNFNNNVGYVSTGNDTISRKNTTKTLGLGEHLRLTYRTGLMEFGVRGGLNYQHSRNKLQKNADMDTWNFNYGFISNVTFDWDMQISTDISMNSRRGYVDHSMNNNELIWNAQLSQSFFKDKAATLSVVFRDILHNQSNVSRVINAQMRSDSWNNSINSYVLFKFVYRLNIFGGKISHQTHDYSYDRGKKKAGAYKKSGRLHMMKSSRKM